MSIEQSRKDKQGTVVDVRTSAEFSQGNIPDSINIPLKEIPYRLEELRNLKSPLVLCCASGSRSEQAQRYLEQQGVHCSNGGSWLEAMDN